MRDYTDEELMSFVKKQDISAFEELFGRYERRVFSFFCRLIWNAEEAKDCTQETFLRLWKGRIRYAPNGRFSTYLFQIAKNHFLHEHKKQKRRFSMHNFSSDNSRRTLETTNSPDSTYNEVVANETQSKISRAVTSLPEIHRLVYVLSEEQRLSYKEIAEVLECPVGTVSSRKVEAVKKLRKLLEPLRDEIFDKSSQVKKIVRKVKNSEEANK
jgi:RNA polymerase sigma-70 factor (ECF subfamily)